MTVTVTSFFPSHAVDDNVVLPNPIIGVGSNVATIAPRLNPNIDVADNARVSYSASGDGHIVSGSEILLEIRQVGFKFSIP